MEGATHKDGWYKSLSEKLQKRGYNAVVPTLPDTDVPVIEAWVDHLRSVVDDKDSERAVFIGHSIGCQKILRYFETLPIGAKVEATFFVAGWLHLENLEDEEVENIARPWVTSLIDFEKVRAVCDRSLALFSTNDPYVPLSDAQLFKEKLGAEIIIHENAGHFTEEDGYTTPPKELVTILDNS